MTAPLNDFISRLRRKQRVLDRHLRHISTEVEKCANARPCNMSGILWVEKECATSAIVKLAQVQIKWAELELETLRLMQAHTELDDEIPAEELNEDEYRVLCQAMQVGLKDAHAEASIIGSPATLSEKLPA